MKRLLIAARKFAFFALAAIITVFAHAQQPVAQDAAATASTKVFSQQDLDEILAPIALYPDALLAQVLMAATYPLEVVEAARWVKANPNLKGKELETALQEKAWDPAIKSIAAVPQVLAMMDEKLDWTYKLGDAFLAQQQEVMSTVQKLRGKAQEAGNLESTSQQAVKSEVQDGQTVVIIESKEPEVVYVPTYNPSVVYGSWWYPSPPPYYYYPPGYVAGAGLWFAAGVAVGGAIWGNCNWGRGDIDIDINRYNNFNNVNLNNKSWNHNPEHRKGATYRDSGTARKYDRGGDRAAAQSREQFRGRAEQGRAELQGMDRSQLDRQVRDAADRASRDLGSGSGGDARARTSDRAARGSGDAAARTGDRTARSSDLGSRASSSNLSSRTGGSASSSRGSSSSSRGGGFSGAGSGASTRAASSRGSASFGSRSAGGARGGGRR